jgi:hypothetical protein
MRRCLMEMWREMRIKKCTLYAVMVPMQKGVYISGSALFLEMDPDLHKSEKLDPDPH